MTSDANFHLKSSKIKSNGGGAFQAIVLVYYDMTTWLYSGYARKLDSHTKLNSLLLRMRLYRNSLRLISFYLYMLVCIEVKAVNNANTTGQAKLYNGKYCPTTITINAKRYFEAYLKIGRNGSTSGIFPPLLTCNLSTNCCQGQNISIEFVSETTRTSVQKLLWEESEKRKRGNVFNNTNLEFYFPTYTTKADSSKVYKEFYFIEVMKSPGPAFVMLVDELEEPPDPSLVLIECWPIFLLLLVMAWVVGIIAWFLDRKKNKQQFPANFFRGTWVGFWWAVVTMTTVGYGDKTPKSFPARFLTVLWMICGTIVISLFTANVTAVLTTKNVATLQNVLGQKVGVLNSKHFFQREINEGASFIEYEDQKSMFEAFNNREITRILVPNYLDHLYFTTTQHFDKDFVIVNIIKHTFSAGLALVGNEEDLDDETMGFLRCWERNIVNNWEESGLDYSIIDPSLFHAAENARSLLNQGSILRLTYGLLAVLFLFLVIGTLWEFRKRSERKGEMDTMIPSEIELTKRQSPTIDRHGDGFGFV